MKQYKKGTKFKVCSLDDLLKKGWMIIDDLLLPNFDKYGKGIKHKDFGEIWMRANVIRDYERQILTVTDNLISPIKNWYIVEENLWQWPVDTFLTETDVHKCEEGMTPIDGWIICKTCGTNLFSIK